MLFFSTTTAPASSKITVADGCTWKTHNYYLCCSVTPRKQCNFSSENNSCFKTNSFFLNFDFYFSFNFSSSNEKSVLVLILLLRKFLILSLILVLILLHNEKRKIISMAYFIYYYAEAAHTYSQPFRAKIKCTTRWKSKPVWHRWHRFKISNFIYRICWNKK